MACYGDSLPAQVYCGKQKRFWQVFRRQANGDYQALMQLQTKASTAGNTCLDSATPKTENNANLLILHSDFSLFIAIQTFACKILRPAGDLSAKAVVRELAQGMF